MRTIKRLLIISLFFILICLCNNVHATSISASPSSPKVGQAVTITVSVPNVNTVDLTASVSGAGTSGTIRLVDGSMTGDARTFSKSITVTPTTTGTISVSVSGGSNAVLNGEYVGVGASASFSVSEAASSGGSSSSSSSSSSSGRTSSSYSSSSNKTTTEKPKEVEKSSVNSLSEITIEGQTLSPEFNVDVREYTVNVPFEITSLNVTATPTDSKATVKVEGNEELKEGENTITITITAEDGSESKYLIRVIRAREPLALKSLVIKYTNQEGELIEIPLNPEFKLDVLEYTLEDLEYWVEKLLVEAEANLQDATIEIQGADEIVVGENTIIIKLTIKESEENLSEGEEPKEETITYTIKVNKAPEPTFWEKVKNRFKAVFGGVFSWYNNNQQKIVLYSLCACVVALVGLSVYIVIDYSKYKTLVQKLKKLEQINNGELVSENYVQSEVQTENDVDNIEKTKGGKHF